VNPPVPGDCDLCRADLGNDQDVTGQNLGGLRALDVDDVKSERRLDRPAISPGRTRNATSSNSFTITPRRNHPSSPPWAAEALSPENRFAAAAKSAPGCRSATTSDSASCNARCRAAESATGLITI